MPTAGTRQQPLPFWPPFCPNPLCRSGADSPRFGFLRHGHYSTRIHGRRVPRFICRACRRTMSSQTFAETYRLRHPDLDDAILTQMALGLSLRKVAQILGVNRKTISRRLIRARRMGGTSSAAGSPRVPETAAS